MKATATATSSGKTQASQSSNPFIASVSGGLSGLTLLLTLHKHGIPAILDEHELSALQDNDLEKQWQANSHPESNSKRLCDGQKLLVSLGDGDNQYLLDLRLEIDRSTLRQTTLDAVHPDAGKWGHALSSIRPLGGGEHKPTFESGCTTVSDILVGVDGARSRVRPLVSAAQPLYHGITGAEVSLSPSTTALPETTETVANAGKGTLYAVENGQMLCAQMNGDGRIRTYLLFPGPEDWALPPDPGAAREKLLRVYEGWAPWMRKLIERCDDEAMYARPLYHLPLDHRWAHVPGVTILGDAAHLMSPFAGSGANIAMVDGFELGVMLAGAIEGGKSTKEREAAIAAWEDRRMKEGRRVGVVAARYLAGTFS